MRKLNACSAKIFLPASSKSNVISPRNPHNTLNCSKEGYREKSIDPMQLSFGIGSPSIGQRTNRSKRASADNDAACRTNSAAIKSPVEAP